MEKKYAAVLDLTPCVRVIQRNAKKQGEIISDKQAIRLLAVIISKKTN